MFRIILCLLFYCIVIFTQVLIILFLPYCVFCMFYLIVPIHQSSFWLLHFSKVLFLLLLLHHGTHSLRGSAVERRSFAGELPSPMLDR